jgi:hypothetical protein
VSEIEGLWIRRCWVWGQGRLGGLLAMTLCRLSAPWRDFWLRLLFLACADHLGVHARQHMKIQDYKIAKGRTLPELQLAVNEELKKGLEPIGGVSIAYANKEKMTGIVYVQALVRK